MNLITEAIVLEKLKQVIDPEIACNIVDLGLIYSVNITGPNVTVTMTLTTPGCPMHESIATGVENALSQVPGIADIQVAVVWDPPWNPSMMTDAARAATGAC
jgi:metal-sulfur cluster biosynthetic enzyme